MNIMTHKIQIQRCLECKQYRWPVAPACPFCFSEAVESVESKGNGALWTFTIAHRAHPEFMKDVPFAVGVIALDESPGTVRLLGRIVDCELDAVKIGMRLELKSYDEEKGTYSFRPVAAK